MFSINLNVWFALSYHTIFPFLPCPTVYGPEFKCVLFLPLLGFDRSCRGLVAAMTLWRIAGRQISSQGNMCSASSLLHTTCALLPVFYYLCSSPTTLLNICSALLTTRAARLSPIAQLSDSRRTADRRDHYRVYCQDQEIPENWADMRQRSEIGRVGSKGRKTGKWPIQFIFPKEKGRELQYLQTIVSWDWVLRKVGSFS